MRIFLDVGAHEGQTLEEVLKPEWGFDVIYAFEPMPEQYRILVERFEESAALSLLNYGLSDCMGIFPVYGTNKAMEASLYPTKLDVDATFITECEFMDAAEFFRLAITEADTVIMKLNCEGAEALILETLIRSGEIEKVTNVMIDFDIRKIPDQAHREFEILESLMAINFTRYSLCEEAMKGATHQARIAHWLDRLGLR